RGAAPALHRGTHQLVPPLQGERREARLGRREEGRRGRARPVAPRSGPRALRRGEADAVQGAADLGLRARPGREDRRGQRRDHPRRGPRLLRPPSPVPRPSSPAGVRPVVLALAPPAPGLSRDTSIPCLERLGGSRLIDRLLETMHAVGLPAPLVVSDESAHRALRATLGHSMSVGAVPGGREAALRAVLDRCDEALLLHDAERAVPPPEVVREVWGALREDDDAVVPVVAMTDSVKEVRAEGLRNIDRASLAGLQSPRLMRRGVLESALDDDGRPADAGGFDEIRAALDRGARVRTVHGSHSGFAVLDRLSLWQAQISLGLARDTSHRQGLTRRS